MDPNKIINSLGGTNAVAELCEVTKSAVSQWRKAGIPHSWIKYLRAIRPDVFGNESAESEKAAA